MQYQSWKDAVAQFKPADADENWDLLFAAGVKMADHTEISDDLLKLIDGQLRYFGLEVVQVEFHGDSYVWYFDKYTPPSKYTPVWIVPAINPDAYNALTKHQKKILGWLCQRPNTTADELWDLMAIQYGFWNQGEISKEKDKDKLARTLEELVKLGAATKG